MHFTHQELDLLYELARQESRRLSSKYWGTEPEKGSRMDLVLKLDQKLTANLRSRRNGF